MHSEAEEGLQKGRLTSDWGKAESSDTCHWPTVILWNIQWEPIADTQDKLQDNCIYWKPDEYMLQIANRKP